jgi:hypothetical protein
VRLHRACCYDTEASAQGREEFQLLAYALVEEELDEAGNRVAVVVADDIFVKGLPELPVTPMALGCAGPVSLDRASERGSCTGDFALRSLVAGELVRLGK